MSDNGLLAITFTDTNGNFKRAARRTNPSERPATDCSWLCWIEQRYQGQRRRDGVTLAVPRATALFYGSVTDNLGIRWRELTWKPTTPAATVWTERLHSYEWHYFLGIVGGLERRPVADSNQQ